MVGLSGDFLIPCGRRKKAFHSSKKDCGFIPYINQLHQLSLITVEDVFGTGRKEWMYLMKNNYIVDVTKVEWSQPMGLKELSQIFDIHRNTMSKWLKDQVICNQQLSPRRWRIATFELPKDYNGKANI